MLTRLTSFIRNRWHPLWRLRRLAAYRWFQRRFDFTVDTRIPGTDCKVAVKLMRDAGWIVAPGNLEPEIRTVFGRVLDLVKPEVFWDVGANIGFYSWCARRHPAVRQVVMFEPDPVNFSLLSRTIRKNGFTDCQAMNVALSDATGTTRFLVDAASGAAGSLESVSLRAEEHHLQNAYQMTDTVNCRMETVDHLIETGTPPPGLMKIDVEGAEHLVIAGAAACLKRFQPAMIIETFDAGFVRRFRDTGYLAYRIDPTNYLFIAPGPDLSVDAIARAFSEYEKAGP